MGYGHGRSWIHSRIQPTRVTFESEGIKGLRRQGRDRPLRHGDIGTRSNGALYIYVAEPPFHAWIRLDGRPGSISDSLVRRLTLGSLVTITIRTEYYGTGLEASVATQGVLHPIVVTEDGALLDGNHRLETARALGVNCPCVVMDDPESIIDPGSIIPDYDRWMAAR